MKLSTRLEENISYTCRNAVELPPVLLDNKIKNKPVQKQKRVQLFENEDIVLGQRGNRYYLSLYDKEGKFQREVTIDVKDDYKVGLGNCK